MVSIRSFHFISHEYATADAPHYRATQYLSNICFHFECLLWLIFFCFISVFNPSPSKLRNCRNLVWSIWPFDLANSLNTFRKSALENWAHVQGAHWMAYCNYRSNFITKIFHLASISPAAIWSHPNYLNSLNSNKLWFSHFIHHLFG